MCLKKECAALAPQLPYWPSSPSSGGGFDDPNGYDRGDVHCWDVWHGLKPFEDYRGKYPRFCSEFGFESFPCLKTVEAYTLPEDRNIFSRVMESHQKCVGGNGKIMYYLSQNYRYPTRFDHVLYASQLLQAEAMRAGVEHWRRYRGRCMGRDLLAAQRLLARGQLGEHRQPRPLEAAALCRPTVFRAGAHLLRAQGLYPARERHQRNARFLPWSGGNPPDRRKGCCAFPQNGRRGGFQRSRPRGWARWKPSPTNACTPRIG